MFDKNYIRDIADILVEKNLDEIEIDGTRLRIKSKNAPKQETLCVVHENNTPKTTIEETTVDTVVKTQEPVVDTNLDNIFEVKASIGGKFYKAPYPNGQDFVYVGKKIKIGDTIGIIETNKGKHHIPSPVDGEVVEIMSSPVVDFGKPILKIKR